MRTAGDLVGMNCINLLGNGGHSTVVSEIAEQNGFSVCKVFEYWPGKGLLQVKSVHDACVTDSMIGFAWAVALGDQQLRRVAQSYIKATINGAVFPVLASNRSYLLGECSVGEGSVIMPFAVVNSHAQVGKFVILNSSALVEHHSNVGDFSHCAPNSVVLGHATIGEDGFIGANSVVAPGIALPPRSKLGALSFLRESYDRPGTYMGIPATLKAENQQ